MSSAVHNLVSPFQARLMEAFLNDITTPQAIWKVRVGCHRNFLVSVTLTGSDKIVRVSDIVVGTGCYIFEILTDQESDVGPVTVRLTDLGKDLLRQVAEGARRQLEQQAAA